MCHGSPFRQIPMIGAVIKARPSKNIAAFTLIANRWLQGFSLIWRRLESM